MKTPAAADPALAVRSTCSSDPRDDCDPVRVHQIGSLLRTFVLNEERSRVRSKRGEPIEHASATVVDAHPMAIIEARLEQLGGVLARVAWDGGTVVGMDW